MCGLVGVAGNLYKKHVDAFQQLLFIDQLRGAHSTGVSAVSNTGLVSTYKRAVNAADFLQLAQPTGLYSLTNRAIIGHNRHATSGAHIDMYAHPFTHNHITLTHNGTLLSRRGLSSSGNFTVDSENIAHEMSIVDDPIALLEQLHGSYALVWYDAEHQTINFARNDKRTLSIAWCGDSIMWASEREMIDLVCARNGIEPEKVVDLREGILFTVSLAQPKLTKDSHSSRQFTPYVPTYQQSGRSTKANPTLPGLSDLGFKPSEEIYFQATEFIEYSGQTTGRGTLWGLLWDGSDDVIVYNIHKSSLKFDSKGRLDLDEIYSGEVTGVTTVFSKKKKQGTNTYALNVTPTSVKNADDYAMASLVRDAKGNVVIIPEKKQTTSSTSSTDQSGKQPSTDDDGSEDTAVVAGVEVELSLALKIASRGCCWCGDPFTLDELKDVQIHDSGEYVHVTGSCLKELKRYQAHGY